MNERLIFTELKFFRTYIEGSRIKERKIINEVDNNLIESNLENAFLWVKLKNLLNTQQRDVLHVLYSWQFICKYLTFIFMSLAIIISFFKVFTISYLLFSISIIGLAINIIIKVRIKKWETSCILVDYFAEQYLIK